MMGPARYSTPSFSAILVISGDRFRKNFRIVSLAVGHWSGGCVAIKANCSMSRSPRTCTHVGELSTFSRPLSSYRRLSAGFSDRWQHPELVQQTHRVVLDPGLYDLAVLDAPDDEPAHPNLFACSRNAEQFALVGAVTRHTARDLVSFGDQVVHRVISRGRSLEHREQFLQPPEVV